MHIAARENFAQCAADGFADSQLPLGRAGALVGFVLCHMPHLRGLNFFAKAARARYTAQQDIRGPGAWYRQQESP